MTAGGERSQRSDPPPNIGQEGTVAMNDLEQTHPRINPEKHIGELSRTVLKRAIMAAWEAGSITGLEAWWLIQREGLQHK